MPLPQLRTQQNFFLPDPASQLLKAAQLKNYMAQEAARPLNTMLKQSQIQNTLLEGRYKKSREERAITEEERKKQSFKLDQRSKFLDIVSKTAGLYKTAAESPSKELAEKIADAAGFGIEWYGPMMKITDETRGIEVEVPKTDAASFFKAIEDDPTLITNEPMANDPTMGSKVNHINAFLKSKKGSLRIFTPGGKRKPAKLPASVLDFEMTEYGKEVPSLRGTPEYKKKRLDWIQAKKAPKAPSYATNLMVAAQSIGLSPERVRSGELSPDEATGLADKYTELFGKESLIEMLLSSGIPRPKIPTKFDAQGNAMETSLQQPIAQSQTEEKPVAPKEIKRDKEDIPVLEALFELYPPGSNVDQTKTDSKTGRKYYSNGDEWYRIE